MDANRRILFLLIILSFIGVLAYIQPAFSSKSAATPRPSYWAQPLQREGLPNLYRVTATLYRGAQPTATGMRRLKTMGVKTVINLRSFNSDRDELGDTGLGYVHICMKAWHPEREDIIRFLQVVTDKKRSPAFVHCQHGADRTGLMCAIYRVAVCGWTKQEAIREMTRGGFGHHVIWTNHAKFIQDLDINTIKKQTGIGAASSPSK
jgi:tyrosine-protein phosphatase SIW14